jgi:hypothetical protein
MNVVGAGAVARRPHRREEASMNGNKLLGLVAIAAAIALGTTTAGANVFATGTVRADS